MIYFVVDFMIYFVVDFMIYFVVEFMIYHELSLWDGNKYKLHRSPWYFTQFKFSICICLTVHH
jgi:hypothetical protein